MCCLEKIENFQEDSLAILRYLEKPFGANTCDGYGRVFRGTSIAVILAINYFYSFLWLLQIMEKLEIIITVLLLCLVALGAYVATAWTLAWKKKKEDEGGRVEVPYKYLEEEAENARKKVATAYAQETMPKITITPVQPRPDFPRVRDMSRC